MLSVILKTAIEFILCALLIYGFIHEKEVIKFEQRIKRIIVLNYRRNKNKNNIRKSGRKCARLKIINGRKADKSKPYRKGFDVA